MFLPKGLSFFTLLLLGIATAPSLRAEDSKPVPRREIIVSVKEQKLLLLTDGKPEARFTISTSRFGTGDRWGSYATPLGKFVIRSKIGMGLPLGAVLHSRRPTGEILKPNAPGRDPIVSRILWLDGSEPGNRNAFSRCIYIHGTPREKDLGRPASYGCVRMSSSDVALLSERVEEGVQVTITPGGLPKVRVLSPVGPSSPTVPVVAQHLRREPGIAAKAG